MAKFNWLKYCIPCKSWCCKGENPYTSKGDGYTGKIKMKPNGDCEFQEEGKCSIYDKRPFECRTFPFDIKRINGKLMWILWKSCPAHDKIDVKKLLKEREESIKKVYSKEYVEAYVKYHEKNEPKKYKAEKYIVLKEF